MAAVVLCELFADERCPLPLPALLPPLPPLPFDERDLFFSAFLLLVEDGGGRAAAGFVCKWLWETGNDL
jgi:hypothetical protein